MSSYQDRLDNRRADRIQVEAYTEKLKAEWDNEKPGRKALRKAAWSEAFKNGSLSEDTRDKIDAVYNGLREDVDRLERDNPSEYGKAAAELIREGVNVDAKVTDVVSRVCAIPRQILLGLKGKAPATSLEEQQTDTATAGGYLSDFSHSSSAAGPSVVYSGQDGEYRHEAECECKECADVSSKHSGNSPFTRRESVDTLCSVPPPPYEESNLSSIMDSTTGPQAQGYRRLP